MSVIEMALEKEVQIVDLDGTEKTWIGGIYVPPRWRGDEGYYLFVRCIRKEDATNKQARTIKVRETNGSYRCRYWTNLPEAWDNKAMLVKEPPETVWKYKHYEDVFENEFVLLDWLADDAHGYWDDGFTEWEEGEFETKCEQYVEERRKECEEIPFEDWLKTAPQEKRHEDEEI